MSYRKLAPGFLALALVFPLIAQADPLPDGLYAEFSTSMGNFTCELDYTGTPRTVANLVGLAEATVGVRPCKSVDYIAAVRGLEHPLSVIIRAAAVILAPLFISRGVEFIHQGIVISGGETSALSA